MSNKVWFITGASRGFGRVWADAALKRGDQVAATARTLAGIADLKDKYGANVLTLQLDVTKPDQVKTVVAQAHAHFGRLDIVLNNAGYSLVGTIEEASADDVRALYDTNIFGTLSVIQAALPLLRKQGTGHILGTSSTLGHVTVPLIGYYCSSKWAFEAIHESLAAEIKPFGIKVTIIEPGAYATEFGSPQSFKVRNGPRYLRRPSKAGLWSFRNHGKRRSECYTSGPLQNCRCRESTAPILSRQPQFALGTCRLRRAAGNLGSLGVGLKLSPGRSGQIMGASVWSYSASLTLNANPVFSKLCKLRRAECECF